VLDALLLYVPVGQTAIFFPSSQKNPGGHGIGTSVPGGHVLPAGHAVHERAEGIPIDGLYFLAGHSVGLNPPAGQ